MKIEYNQLRDEFERQVASDTHETHLAALDRSVLIILDRGDDGDAQQASTGLTRGQKAARTRAKNKANADLFGTQEGESKSGEIE